MRTHKERTSSPLAGESQLSDRSEREGMCTDQWSNANALSYAHRKLGEAPFDADPSNRNDFLTTAIEKIDVALFVAEFGNSEVQLSSAMRDVSTALAGVALSADASLNMILDEVLESFRETGRSIADWRERTNDDR